MKILVVAFAMAKAVAMERIASWHAKNKPNHDLVLGSRGNLHVDQLKPTVTGLHIESSYERLVIIDETKVDECVLVVGQDTWNRALKLDGYKVSGKLVEGDPESRKVILAHETADFDLKLIRLLPEMYCGTLSNRKLSGKKVKLWN